jgi:hypothetical protein
MKVALLSLALLGQAVTVPVSDKVPVLDVEASCKATTDDAKAMGLTKYQSFSDCMHDEMTARQKIETMWATSDSAVRDQCKTVATTGGGQSYVDLLTCLQASAIAAHPELPSGKGASKDRNKH